MSASPPLRKLQYALAVVREAHFRTAAARINVSQPSLSRQIKKSEIENGIEVPCGKNSKIMPQDASASDFRECLAPGSRMTYATGQAQLNSGGKHVEKPRQFWPGHFEIQAASRHENRQEPEGDSVQFALTLIQGKWKIGILSHLQHGPARLSQLRKALPGASKKMLVQHLREMERDGLVMRTDMSGKLPHVEYSLTNPLGLAAVRLLSILAQWAADYCSSELGPSELSQDDLPNLVDT